MPVEKPGSDADYWCKDCNVYVTGQEMHLHKGKCNLVPVDKKKATLATPPSEVADQLMYDRHFATMRDTEQIYFWNDVYWIRYGESWIKQIVQIGVHNVNTHFVNEVLNQVRRRTFMDRERFMPPQNHINVENGIINVRTMQFMPHDRHYYFRNIMPVKYDPSARCPRILKFLTDCLDSKEIVNLMEEFASCFISTKLEKAYMHIGTGANGKSTSFKILQALLGKSSYSAISIHDLLYNRFSRAELDGKIANIFPDISTNEIKNVNFFKALVSGDVISAEKKGKDPFDLINNARMFFSTNQLPEITEDTDAVFRRFNITEWTEQFADGKQNSKLIDELTTPTELSGLLNMLLANARKLMSNGKFSYGLTIDQMRKMWHERSDPVELFVKQYLIVKPDLSIYNDRMHYLYNQYCAINHFSPESDRVFGKHLNKFIPVHSEVTTRGGRRLRIYRGIGENVDYVKSKGMAIFVDGSSALESFSSQNPIIDIPQSKVDVVDVVSIETNLISNDEKSQIPQSKVDVVDVVKNFDVVDVVAQKEEIGHKNDIKLHELHQNEKSLPQKLSDSIVSKELTPSFDVVDVATQKTPEIVPNYYTDHRINTLVKEKVDYKTLDVDLSKMIYKKQYDDNVEAFICYTCNKEGAGPYLVNEIDILHYHQEHEGMMYMDFTQYLNERFKPRYRWSGN
jgi:P4 family phage/plasmid primase-like protien